MILLCPYCKALPELVDSLEVYSRSYGNIWLCRPCQAWVGVHKRSNDTPLGRLANKELRDWKKKAHVAFDPRWEQRVKKGEMKFVARNSEYAWLASKLNIPVEECHIGMFNVDQCKQAVRYCLPFLTRFINR